MSVRLPEAARSIERLYLAPNEGNAEVYYPLQEHPGLAREFAAISDANAALEFATRYGLLGLRGPGREDVGAEDVGSWLLEAHRLQMALHVWDLLDAKDTRGLRGIFRWEEGSVMARFPNRVTRWIAGTAHNPQWLRVWHHGDVVGPAKLFLVEEFNQVMDGKASPTLLLDANGNFKPYSTPVSLLAALWLQFSEVMTGVRALKPCELCGSLMDVTDNRHHKRMHDHCSLRLRMARYRGKSRSGQR